MTKIALSLLLASCAATAPAPTTSALTAPRCVPSCPGGQHCVQLNNEPGRPPLPPHCAPN